MALVSDIFAQRKAGVLLHPSSLPGPYISGILDSHAFRFVDFLSSCHFKLWQILPLCPVFNDGSPYNSTSAFAGNPELISVQRLYSEFFQNHDVAEPKAPMSKGEKLQQGFELFQESTDHPFKSDYQEFKESQKDWLESFALFTVLQTVFDDRHWNAWPDEARSQSKDYCTDIKKKHQEEYEFVLFKQFVFYKQWQSLKAYANSKGIQIIGDIPIFVSDNSADVWSTQSEFKLDESGRSTVVAGVPPDYFSETGQRWGNPIYDWEVMEKNDFRWWVRRMAHALEHFDIVRIDHFRGLAATWEIPADEPTAINGQWVATPGNQLLAKFNEEFGDLPIIAEDLGIITEDVEKLRDDFNLPGMKILQFAFDSDALNPYLPHNHVQNCVVYTGTHDNDTTVGWSKALSSNTKDRLHQYLAWPGEQMPWPLIKSALSSVAKISILPMQDVLSLDGKHRMNTPGTIEGNWQWRFHWDQLSHELSGYLARLNDMYLRS